MEKSNPATYIVLLYLLPYLDLFQAAVITTKFADALLQPRQDLLF